MAGVKQNRYKTNNGCVKHLPQTGYNKNLIFFSLPVGPVDIVAFAVCLDCGNVSRKINNQLDLNFLPTQVFCTVRNYTRVRRFTYDKTYVRLY